MSSFKNISACWAVMLCLSTAFIPTIGSAAVDESGYDINKVNANVEVSDPIEPVNRAIYGFNRVLDKVILKPVAQAYKFIVPELGRKGISNVLQNLGEPVTCLNAVLQGDRDRATKSFGRFLVNSTWGIGGLGDVASDAGLKYRKEDSGQTMGTYGIGGGAYLMLPILGPSNTRDTFGLAVDTVTDPFNYIFNDYISGGRALMSGLDSRTDKLELVDEIDRISLDPYAAIRSLYTQKRNSDIKNK
jgi:phospholipid-binding lipoprotein MlaA